MKTKVPISHQLARVLAPCVAFCIGLVFLSRSAGAEIIELLDQTKLSGTVVHYYDGVFSVNTGDAVVKIPKEKIKKIEYALPPPRSEFSTPKKTFERWKMALTKGDIETVIECYSLMYQGFLAAQMGQSDDAMNKMRDEVKGTKFSIKKATIDEKKRSASLQVSREKNGESDDGEIGFVKENGEWKMLPPQ